MDGNTGIKTKKAPYQELWIFIPILILPSLFITGLLYWVISMRQPQFGQDVNWATAKVFGCGAGVLFHLSCWLAGVFEDDLRAVKTRMKEFFANIVVSARLAFSCYWEDVKTLGLDFWIDFAVIALNAGVFIDALLDYLTLRGSI